MSTHNRCFSWEIKNILCGYPLLSGAKYISPKYLFWRRFMSYDFSSYLKYKTHSFCKAYWKEQWANSLILWNYRDKIPYETVHDKTYNKTCVTSKDLDQPVHPPSKARVLVYLSLDSLEAVEGTCDQLWSDCFQHVNLMSGNKILWKRGEMAPKEPFLLFSTLFSRYI